MRSRKTIQGVIEILAGIALGIACVAVADTLTTAPNTRLLIAITVIVCAVLAEWGARHAIHKARGGNQSKPAPGRSRRG